MVILIWEVLVGISISLAAEFFIVLFAHAVAENPFVLIFPILIFVRNTWSH